MSMIKGCKPIVVPAEMRFLFRIECFGDGCWMWIGNKRHLGMGYGVFYMGGKLKHAHRVSWELFNGPIPNGLCVLHKCDRALCVNPEHLFLGTNDDNVRDKVQKRRHRFGITHRAAKLTEDQVYEIRRKHSFWKARAIGREYGVSHHTVMGIVRREIWRHLPERP